MLFYKTIIYLTTTVMMRRRVLPYIIALLVSPSLAWNTISQENWLSTLRKNDQTIVAFVAPWTDACKSFEPEWTKVEKAEKSAITIDCTVSSEFCHENDVVSYPAIRLYSSKGLIDKYRGPRKADKIISYIQRSARPAVVHLDNKTIKSFSGIDDVVIIAHLTQDDTKVRDIFEKLSSRYHDQFSFAVAVAGGNARVVCYNNAEDEKHTTTKLLSIDSLDRFIQMCTTPLVGELTRRNEGQFLKGDKSLVYYFSANDGEREAYKKSIRPTASQYREYLNFVTVDSTEYPDMLPALGLKRDTSTPGLAVQNPAYGYVYPYTYGKQITAQTVMEFVSGIAEGRITPWSPGEGNMNESHDEL